MWLINPFCFKSVVRIIILTIFLQLPIGYIVASDSHLYPNTVTDTTGFNKMVLELRYLLINNDLSDEAASLNVRIEKAVASGLIKNKMNLSDAYFVTGVYYYRLNRFSEASERLNISAVLREELNVRDQRYASCITNIGIIYFSIGDFQNAYKYGRKGLKIKREIFGNDSTKLVSDYVNLASICLQLYELDKALANAEAGIAIVKLHPDSIPRLYVANLYHDVAMGLNRKGESAKALIYATQALNYYDPNDDKQIDSWISIIDVVTNIYTALNKPEMAEKYYRIGMNQSNSGNIQYTQSLFISYANFLARQQKFAQAEDLFLQIINRVKASIGTDNSDYTILLTAYASFLYKKIKMYQLQLNCTLSAWVI